MAVAFPNRDEQPERKTLELVQIKTVEPIKKF
jgi:hypothetical protein